MAMKIKKIYYHYGLVSDKPSFLEVDGVNILEIKHVYDLNQRIYAVDVVYAHGGTVMIMNPIRIEYEPDKVKSGAPFDEVGTIRDETVQL